MESNLIKILDILNSCIEVNVIHKMSSTRCLSNLLAVDGELGAEQRRRGAGGPQGQVAEEGPLPPLAPAPAPPPLGWGGDRCYLVVCWIFNHHLHQRMPQLPSKY